MKVQCQKIEYEEGSWGEIVERSKLILYAASGNENLEFWIDRFFKDQIGRLTEKRRMLISQEMPQFVNVEPAIGQKGTKYYVVSKDDLNEWLIRCNDPDNISKVEYELKKSRPKRKKTRRKSAVVSDTQYDDGPSTISMPLPRIETTTISQSSEYTYRQNGIFTSVYRFKD